MAETSTLVSTRKTGDGLPFFPPVRSLFLIARLHLICTLYSGDNDPLFSLSVSDILRPDGASCRHTRFYSSPNDVVVVVVVHFLIKGRCTKAPNPSKTGWGSTFRWTPPADIIEIFVLKHIPYGIHSCNIQKVFIFYFFLFVLHFFFNVDFYVVHFPPFYLNALLLLISRLSHCLCRLSSSVTDWWLANVDSCAPSASAWEK